MNHDDVITIARTILDGSDSRADVVALALHVLGKGIGVPVLSGASCGGGENPAAPANAPVSKKSVTVSPACNLGGPSGPEAFPKEADTKPDIANAATVPTVYPTAGMDWQDDKIAVWLESHAGGYEHGGFHEVAQTLRKKAMQIRRREYLET